MLSDLSGEARMHSLIESKASCRYISLSMLQLYLYHSPQMGSACHKSTSSDLTFQFSSLIPDPFLRWLTKLCSFCSPLFLWLLQEYAWLSLSLSYTHTHSHALHSTYLLPMVDYSLICINLLSFL